MRARRPPWPLSVAAPLLVSVLIAVALFAGRQWALSDVLFYYEWSALVAQGEVPYRDFFFDYPPLSLPVLLAPRLVTGFSDIAYGSYLVLFAAGMTALGIGLSQVVRRIVWRLRDVVAGQPLRRHLLLMTLSLPILFVRYDLWPILLTALAFKVAIDRRPGLSGVLLGIGIAAKLYPAVLVPVFAGYWWFAGERRACLHHVVAATLVAVAGIVPFALLAEGGLVETLQFQQERGLQIETSAAGIIQLLGLGAADRPLIVHETTFELVSDRVDVFLAVQPVIALLAIGGTLLVGWYRLRQAAGSPQAPMVLAAASVAVLLAFMLTNRALSPQHIFWVLPFAALLSGYRFIALVTAIVMTLLIFPLLYEQLLAQQAGVVLLLNARNALLIGLAIAVLIRPWDRVPSTR